MSSHTTRRNIAELERLGLRPLDSPTADSVPRPTDPASPADESGLAIEEGLGYLQCVYGLMSFVGVQAVFKAVGSPITAWGIVWPRATIIDPGSWIGYPLIPVAYLPRFPMIELWSGDEPMFITALVYWLLATTFLLHRLQKDFPTGMTHPHLALVDVGNFKGTHVSGYRIVDPRLLSHLSDRLRIVQETLRKKLWISNMVLVVLLMTVFPTMAYADVDGWYTNALLFVAVALAFADGTFLADTRRGAHECAMARVILYFSIFSGTGVVRLFPFKIPMAVWVYFLVANDHLVTPGSVLVDVRSNDAGATERWSRHVLARSKAVAVQCAVVLVWGFTPSLRPLNTVDLGVTLGMIVMRQACVFWEIASRYKRITEAIQSFREKSD